MVDWFCRNCYGGPMIVGLHTHCIYCGRIRDIYLCPPPPPPQSRGQRSQGSSASHGAARRGKATASVGKFATKVDISSSQSTSDGSSAKSGSPINIHHDVTPEETPISLSKVSKHAHGPSDRRSLSKEPVDEAQYHKGSEKSAIRADEFSIREGAYEQWIADDVLRNNSEDTRVNDDVEPQRGHDSSSDPESDLDFLGGPLVGPRTSDRSSEDPVTSKQIRRKINKRPLSPPVIDMLLVRACGIVARLFEANPLPGRTRIRWRCVRYPSYVLLIQKYLFP